MVGLVLWFVLEIHGSYRGGAERAATLVEALWPLAIVLSLRLNTKKPLSPNSSLGLSGG